MPRLDFSLLSSFHRQGIVPKASLLRLFEDIRRHQFIASTSRSQVVEKTVKISADETNKQKNRLQKHHAGPHEPQSQSGSGSRSGSSRSVSNLLHISLAAILSVSEKEAFLQ